VFADPELTLALPPAVTAATGMDALTHNIESYLSPAYHPLCDGIALEGLRIAAPRWHTAVRSPATCRRAADMMMASMMGAIAFQKDLGAVHSCAHALGAVCDLHHGLANALMIDTVMAWNYEAVPAKFDELAHVCKVAGGGAAFVPWLKRSRPASASPARWPRTASLKIGISACFLHPDAQRSVFAFKTLQYIEQSMAHWVMSAGALPVMIPSPEGDTARGDVGLDDYAQWLDGLVMHGGADVWPGSYGEEPLQPHWSGDRVRDEYEIALVKAFAAAGKPVFGICRGLQLINVAFGGTLYQDISTQQPGALVHRDGQIYDNNFHTLDIVPGSRLSRLLPDASSYKINSIHHQGIKDLAPGFAVEARCPDDGMIEAIRLCGNDTGRPWVAAVQWHPEFHKPEQGVIDDAPILNDFLAAARATRS
jgi:putative glutamine amidotransferase